MHHDPGVQFLARWSLPLGLGGVLTHPTWTKKTKLVVAAVIVGLLAVGIVVYVLTGQSSET